MFTGIIEAVGTIVEIQPGVTGGLRVTVESPLSSSFRVDQSVSHDGVCLTVVQVNGNRHQLDVVEETLQRSRFGELQIGDHVNLERSMKTNARLDGHIVQGHVDAVGVCTAIRDGYYAFRYPAKYATLVVEKGSICINGVSLTVAALEADTLEVALIPYTLEHTNLGTLQAGSKVNLEFDVLGKYVQKHLEHYSPGNHPERVVL
ncbi:MAG: riboflavin synthase [Saprospiraceae bacterium]|nr:riboflavin synthase [Saprospiraceae bacterium]